MKNINTINVRHNLISDVSVLDYFAKPISMNFHANCITNFTPFIRILDYSVNDEVWVDMRLGGQQIYLPVITVSTTDEISYEITNLSGNKEELSLGSPSTVRLNELEGCQVEEGLINLNSF